MSFRTTLYDQLPESVKPIVKEAYNTANPKRESPKNIQEKFVQRNFDSEEEYHEYVSELYEGEGQRHRNEMLETYRSKGGRGFNTDLKTVSGGLDNDAIEKVYALLRKLKPNIVVETGVNNGWSSSHILMALDRNDRGTLHSIDLPPAEESFPDDESTGWIIPEALRGRWELHLGRSQRILPEVMADFEEIDVFFHDSEHSEPCMMFEFELAWERLSDKGILLSDDIYWNDAFRTFSEERGATAGLLSIHAGYLTKN